MGLQSFVYNALFKRTSTFLVTIIATSIVFERGFDMASDHIFERINKGRLWKDIKHKYEKDE